MGSWISVGGELHPAKEHVVLPHLTGTKNEIYDGPDRAALYLLWEESGKPTDPKKAMTMLGNNYRNDPEFIGRVRQMGFSNVDEYFKMIGYDEKAEMAKMKELASTVTSHQVVKRAQEVEIQGGGVETGSGKVLATGAIGDVQMPV